MHGQTLQRGDSLADTLVTCLAAQHAPQHTPINKSVASWILHLMLQTVGNTNGTAFRMHAQTIWAMHAQCGEAELLTRGRSKGFGWPLYTSACHAQESAV